METIGQKRVHVAWVGAHCCHGGAEVGVAGSDPPSGFRTDPVGSSALMGPLDDALPAPWRWPFPWTVSPTRMVPPLEKGNRVTSRQGARFSVHNPEKRKKGGGAAFITSFAMLLCDRWCRRNAVASPIPRG